MVVVNFSFFSPFCYFKQDQMSEKKNLFFLNFFFVLLKTVSVIFL